MFQLSPQLEYIYLEQIFVSLIPDNQHPVALACLRELYIDSELGKERNCSRILSMISFLPSARVQLSFHGLKPLTQGETRPAPNPEGCTLLIEDTSIKLLQPPQPPSEMEIMFHRKGYSCPLYFLAELEEYVDVSHFTTFDLEHNILLFLPLHRVVEFFTQFTNLETLTTTRPDLRRTVLQRVEWDHQDGSLLRMLDEIFSC